MTKGDWIRSMTNDELVQFLRLVMLFKCEPCCAYNKVCRKEGIEEDFCVLGVEQWVKQEHKENSK